MEREPPELPEIERVSPIIDAKFPYFADDGEAYMIKAEMDYTNTYLFEFHEDQYNYIIHTGVEDIGAYPIFSEPLWEALDDEWFPKYIRMYPDEDDLMKMMLYYRRWMDYDVKYELWKD